MEQEKSIKGFMNWCCKLLKIEITMAQLSIFFFLPGVLFFKIVRGNLVLL